MLFSIKKPQAISLNFVDLATHVNFNMMIMKHGDLSVDCVGQ